MVETGAWQKPTVGCWTGGWEVGGGREEGG